MFYCKIQYQGEFDSQWNVEDDDSYHYSEYSDINSDNEDDSSSACDDSSDDSSACDDDDDCAAQKKKRRSSVAPESLSVPALQAKLKSLLGPKEKLPKKKADLLALYIKKRAAD